MSLYKHLSFDDRQKIYLLRAEGISLRKICSLIGRAPSTVSRELKRNSSKIGYLPDTAHNNALKRKNKLSNKINKYPELKAFIVDKLVNHKWSPEIIAARVKMEGFQVSISHESIYKFIYSIEGQLARLYKCLMYQRPKRQIHFSRKHRVPIPEQYHINMRPEMINKRQEFGHFEGDLTFFKGSNSSNLLVLIERLTRKAFIIKNHNKRSIATMNKIYATIANTNNKMCKSITFDNGSEFKKFGILSLSGIKVYFCKPASPWQKGQVESLNAQIHKYIKKSSDIRLVNDADVIEAQNKLNNLPRKILNFLTPNEAWAIYSKHTVALQN